MTEQTGAFEALIYGSALMYEQWQERFLKKNGRIPNFQEELKWIKRTKTKWSKFYEVTDKKS